MWMEVFISGLGEKVELKPIGKSYRWKGESFEVVDEKARDISTEDGELALNFVDTSGPESLPEEQTIYYGKYLLKDLDSGKQVYLDFRDANYPYATGVVDIVSKWEDLDDDGVYEIWNWHGNDFAPKQDLFD